MNAKAPPPPSSLYTPLALGRGLRAGSRRKIEKVVAQQLRSGERGAGRDWGQLSGRWLQAGYRAHPGQPPTGPSCPPPRLASGGTGELRQCVDCSGKTQSSEPPPIRSPVTLVLHEQREQQLKAVFLFPFLFIFLTTTSHNLKKLAMNLPKTFYETILTSGGG